MAVGKPHRWEHVIVAFAKGAIIQQRHRYKHEGQWSVWYTPRNGSVMFHDDLLHEYRVLTQSEPHPWQREKEAYLNGKPVEFRCTPDDYKIDWKWHPVDAWLVTSAESGMLGADPTDKRAIWDRPWLEFRVIENKTHSFMYIHPDVERIITHPDFDRGPKNLKLTFVNGDLQQAEVIR